VAAVIGIAFLIEQLPKEPLAKLFLSPEISQIHQSRPSGTGFQPVMARAFACGCHHFNDFCQRLFWQSL